MLHIANPYDKTDMFNNLLQIEKKSYHHPSKHLLVFKTSWRRLEDMSWRRLQNVFSVTIFRLPRHLEDILQIRLEDFLKTSWRHLERRTEDVLEDEKLLGWRCLVFKTSLRHVFKTYSRRLLGIFTGNICI